MRIIAVLVLSISSTAALATWKPEYANQPYEVQFWYRNAELTPEAQKRFTFKKCCAKSEVVRTQFKVDRNSGGDVWWWLDGGEWRKVPADIVHPNEHAPDGQPTLFVYAGQETCFFPGDGGI